MTNTTYNIGDVLYSSWGYDQTNVSFYQIVGKTGKATLVLQEVGKEFVETHGLSDMAGRVVPDVKYKKGGTFKKRVTKYGHVNISSYETLFKYDGTPKYISWYC